MLGGMWEGHRDILAEGDYGAFEQTVERLLGERLRADKSDAEAFWGALANVAWFGPDGEVIGYSFRAAGDLLAAIRKDEGQLTYMHYYCTAPYATVPDWVEQALGSTGWYFEVGE